MPDLRTLLEFEAAHGHVASSRKDRAIREELEVSPTAYAQQLARAINDPAALLVDPMLVHRLQRLRDRRMGERRSRMAI